jgi:hypothetical protein
MEVKFILSSMSVKFILVSIGLVVIGYLLFCYNCTIFNIYIGAFFAGVAGIIAAIFQIDYNKKTEKEKVASAFYSEIYSFNKALEGFHEGQLGGKTLINLGHIYSEETGLYFVLRKEIFILTPVLVKKISKYYEQLIGINAQIKQYNIGDFPNFDNAIKLAVKYGNDVLLELEKEYPSLKEVSK